MARRLFLSLILLVSLCSCREADLREITSFEKARPVWAQGRETEKNLYLGFRYVLDTEAGASGKSARPQRRVEVRLAASTDYRLTVNGGFVAHGPCVAAHGFYRIDAYDITPYLSGGRDVIAIEVAGYNVSSYYLLNQPSFLQAEILSDGKCVAATGEDGFEAFELDYRSKDSPKLSFQRSTAEDYSLKPDYDSWRTAPDYTGTPVMLAATEDKQLIMRRVSYPDYTLHTAEPVGGNIFRFKCNSSGFFGMKVAVAEPTHLWAGFDELLGEDGHVNHKRLSFDAVVSYDLEPGEYVLETFEPYTMQFAEIHMDSGSAEVKEVYMRDYCNAEVTRASFKSDNSALDRLFEAARETHRQSALDVFMDTPSRERAGWLCDSFFSARVAFDMSGNTSLEHNFIENYLLPDEFKDIDKGMLPMCYPSDHWNHVYIPNWAMWFVIELEEYLHRSGDRKTVDLLRDRIYGLVDCFKPYLNEDGLLEKLSSWVFVEWSAANSFVQDVNYPSNMLYAGMLDAAGRLYGDESLRYQAESVREAVRARSFDGKWFCDNAVRRDGVLERTDNHTEVCQYYAFYFNVATPETYPDLWNTLLTEFGPVRQTLDKHPDVQRANAFIGNYLRLELLSRERLSGQILNETLAEYTKMALLTGTLWENMSTVASCNHGFAAHIEHVLLRDILGVYDVSPTTKTVTLRFVDCGLKSCEGVIPVGKEYIRLSWKNLDGDFHYDLQLPKGYRAVLSPDSK